MSRKGVFGAVVFAVAFLIFVIGAVVFDIFLDVRGGDAATISDGIRWLTFHMTWTVMTFVFGLGCLVGFLFCHLWATPKLVNDSQKSS